MGYLPSLYKVTQVVVTISTLTVCAAATLLFTYQRNLIYPSNFPSGSRTQVPTPDQFNIDEYEDVTLHTPDGESLHAYLMIQTKISDKERARGEEEGGNETTRRRPTVLVFHANAGNMGHRIPLAGVFYKRFGCNVFMLSYRGYGLSTGQASEVGLRIDAQTALDYIKHHPDLKDTVIVAYGQSLGGAVAIDLASRNTKTVQALILENTFLSIPALIPHVMPFIRPFAFLCREYWPSEESIKLLKEVTPVLFLTGRQDELVPPLHMDTLIASCTSMEKVRFALEEGDHNNTCIQPGYFEAVGLFIAKYIIPRTSGGAEAGRAAMSTVSDRYTFAKTNDTGLVDIIANVENSGLSSAVADHQHKTTSTINQRQQKYSLTDSDENEWVEMSARDAEAGSVAPQDIVKEKL